MDYVLLLIEKLSLLSWIFIVIIFILTLGFHRVENNWLKVQGASILTSIGIFGTFLGIVIGLLDFDYKHIETSLYNLLSGLQVAFVSSVAGLLGAMSLKISQLIKYKSQQTQNVNSTINDLHNELIKLNNSFDNFSQNVVESSSDALIQALKEVINDFNSKINEQFGENFKQLNEAVGKLLIWQEQYKQDLDNLIKIEKETVTEMEKASAAYQNLIESSQQFKTVAKNLESLILTMDSQRRSMEESLSAFSTMIDKTKDGLPMVGKQIEQLANQAQESIKKNTELIKSSLEDTSKELKDINEKTKNQVNLLDQSLQRELTEAMEIFGKHLAALSEKFASDYMPLTERLREVLEIANKIK
jgi:uncharacterized phage infection (PIP) family protein YhgE